MSVKKDKTITSNSDLFPNKISLEIMKEIWNEEGKVYTDEQLLMMREFVYILVEVIFKATKKAKLNNYSPLKYINYEAQESNTLREGEYRRAS